MKVGIDWELHIERIVGTVGTGEIEKSMKEWNSGTRKIGNIVIT